MNGRIRNLLLSAMLCFPPLVLAQAMSPVPDRTPTARKAQEAMRADGSRPGDDKLSCEAIGAEMAGLWGQMDAETSKLFAATERANEEANKAQQVLAARAATEGPALMARSMAEGLLAGTNPVAAAVMARMAAAQDHAMMARAATDGQRANAAMQAAAAASADLIDQHADKFPRMKRLTELFEEKQCQPPPGSMEDEDD